MKEETSNVGPRVQSALIGFGQELPERPIVGQGGQVGGVRGWAAIRQAAHSAGAF